MILKIICREPNRDIIINLLPGFARGCFFDWIEDKKTGFITIYTLGEKITLEFGSLDKARKVYDLISEQLSAEAGKE